MITLAQYAEMKARLEKRTPSAVYAHKKRLRQDSKPLLNKLESEWFAFHRNLFPNCPPIRPQSKRYKLANGLWYKPDFTCSAYPCDMEPLRETAWEIKGPFVFRGGFENLKMAAAAWPEVRFILTWKEQGEWCRQIILP